MSSVLVELKFSTSDKEVDRSLICTSKFKPVLEYLAKKDGFYLSIPASTLAHLDAGEHHYALELIREIYAKNDVKHLARNQFKPELFADDEASFKSYQRFSNKCFDSFEIPAPVDFLSSQQLLSTNLTLVDVANQDLDGTLEQLGKVLECSKAEGFVNEQGAETGNSSKTQGAWLDKAATRAIRRLEEISSRLDPIEKGSLRRRLYRQALGYFCAACEIELDNGLSTPPVRKQVTANLIKADVALDRFEYPDVEPLDGWVSVFREDESEIIEVETQLISVSFEHQALSSLSYKPRKHNFLTASSSPDGQKLSLSANDVLLGSSVVLPKVNAKTEILRQTNDQAWLKTKQVFSSNLVQDVSEISLVRFFTFRSGIGAYLKEATTGFSIEYWLEGVTEVPQELTVLSEWSLVLPTCSELVMKAYPLLSVAGVAEQEIDVSAGISLRQGDLVGGCFGVRLIDSLSSTTLDLRFSKALCALNVELLHGGEGEYQGTKLSFELYASDLLDSMRPTSLFVSIV